MNSKRVILLSFILAFVCSFYAQNTTHQDSIDNVVFLVGDAGEPESNTSSVFDALLKLVKPVEEKSTIIFLGDNIYPGGIPNINEEGNIEAKAIISYQLNRLKSSKAKTYYIPGNHDWNQGRRNGLSHVLNEQQFIDSVLANGHSFIPRHGCPGPVDINISENLVLIAIDTQWWLHQHEKAPIQTGDCKEFNTKMVIDNLKDILADNKGKNILLVGHHPIYSKGGHGGKYNVKNHIFPLTNLNKNLYLPLPIIGSIYPFYRCNIGNIQDIPHPDYQYMIRELKTVINGYNDLIYAAGHDHNLQYFYKNNQHFIVSGGGSKVGHTKQLKTPNFSSKSKGFFKLSYMKDGSVIMDTYGIVNDKEELLFTKKLAEKKETPEKLIVDNENIIPHKKTKIVRAASSEKTSSGFKNFVLGKHYRDAWQATIEVPIIEVSQEYGGLTPIQKGGGMQTKSLRLEAKNGNQYVFRSIQKDPSALLPDNMKNTAAADFVQDQMTTAHPYSAFVIPPLAEAAGIIHTNPKLRVIPDEPLLLQYRDEFVDQLVLYEQRAANNEADSSLNFGHSDNLLSSPKMIKKTLHNNIVNVNHKEVARNRLFDMLIGDWDRHQDQWRWAEYTCSKENHTNCSHQEGNNTYYIPIPRDRDQAFVKFDGLIPSISNRTWLLRQLQSFDYDIRDIRGMNFNARHLDRSFTTQLNKEDWQLIAKDLQLKITDKIIEDAIKLWPDSIYKLDGEEITAKLISRKNKLQEFASRYYKVISKQVDVVGSNKKELFEVDRKNDTITSVKVFKIKNGIKQNLVFERDFNRNESKEIVLFGLEGDDKFLLTGEVKKGVLIRIVGGEGNDSIIDNSKVRGWAKRTKYYDSKKEQNHLFYSGVTEVKNLSSNQKMVHRFGRQDFKYDRLAPNLFFGSNVDDGVLIGGGFSITHHGFRKSPYSYKQKFVANRALRSNSFNVIYYGRFTELVGVLDLELDFSIHAPNSITNFYGLGNETKRTDLVDENYNLIRFNEVLFHPKLVKRVNKFNEIKFGANYQFIDIEESEGRFVTSPSFDFIGSTDPTNFIGIDFQYIYSGVDNKRMPTRGVYFNAEGNWSAETNNSGTNYGRVASQFSMFIPLPLNLTYASNVKGARIFNDFKFYQAATLGAQNISHNNGDLRGFRRDRFSGKASLAINQELRLKLFDFKTYLFPGNVGILGFYDFGRVWNRNSTSNLWHKSYGGGFWVMPYDMIIINGSYAKSDEENLIIIKMGFLF